MNVQLPRYVETRPGDLPDAYLLDGARVMPLSRIEGKDGALPSAGSPHLSYDLLATISSMSSTIDSVHRVHAAVSNVHVFGAPVAAMDAMREGALAMHRAEIERRKSSAP